MTKIVQVNTGSPFEEKESYSRAFVIGDWVLMSNTAGRNYKTREMSTDAVEQARQAFHNIEGALAAVGCTLADVVRSRVAIPYQVDAERVMTFVGEKFRGINPASTVTCTPLGHPDFKVEIEITAYRGASKLEREKINIVL